MKAMDNPFPFTDLPRDLQKDIMVIVANDAIGSLPKEPASLKIAAEKIRDLTVANKDLNTIINQPQFTYKLIKNFAERFNVTDETAAKVLGTRGAQERLELQEDFLDIIAGYDQFSKRDFESFFGRGVDIEWVDMYWNTPICAAIVNNKLAAVKALINKGANVNPMFVKYDADYQAGVVHPKVIKIDTTKVGWAEARENQPEGVWYTGGGSVLSFLVTKNIGPDIGRKGPPISQVLEMIKVLLAAGADPEGSEVLLQVKSMSDRPAVVKAIEDAQAKKRAQQ